ncbi:MAG: hypothetical protein FWD59_06085 [Micrococcales bacterium]|nr:hypothetical protein [Micrococcales bacterium]
MAERDGGVAERPTGAECEESDNSEPLAALYVVGFLALGGRWEALAAASVHADTASHTPAAVSPMVVARSGGLG